MKRVINHEAVAANPRALKNNRLRYWPGKLFPQIFGAPIHVQAVLRGPDGRIKSTRSIYNTVTTAGKAGIADQILASPTLNKPTHMAIGTGTGGTTALNAELDRNALTSKLRSGAVVTMVGDWAAGDGTGSLTEAGVLDAASTGNLWLYTTFGVITKAAADVLQITWTLTIA